MQYRTAIAGVVLAGCIAAVAPASFAADLSSPPPSMWAASRPSNLGDLWAGLYAGGSLGYGFGQTAVDGASSSFQFDHTPLYSAFAGFNLTSGNFVYGLEGELTRGSLGGAALPGFAGFNTDINYQATVRARAGFLVSPSLLLFGKAGVTYANMNFTDTLTTNTASSGFTGYTVGLGAEFKMTDQLGLRLDYDYNNLGSSTVAFPDLGTAFSPAYHTLRLGLSYKF